MAAAEIMPRSAAPRGPGDGEALPQAVDRRRQRRRVGGVARLRLGADRPAVAVDDEAEDPLLEIGAVVLGIAALAERLAALAHRTTGWRRP
jgi:hypothetical protein